MCKVYKTLSAMTCLRTVSLTLAGWLSASAILPAQTAPPAPSTQAAAELKISVIGDVPTPIILTAADLAATPRETAEISDQDGSIATLDGLLDHYSAGGRTIANSPNAGDGSRNPNKDPLIGGFNLTQQDRVDLIAFLESLTDEESIHDPKFADPRQNTH